MDDSRGDLPGTPPLEGLVRVHGLGRVLGNGKAICEIDVRPRGFGIRERLGEVTRQQLGCRLEIELAPPQQHPSIADRLRVERAVSSEPLKQSVLAQNEIVGRESLPCLRWPPPCRSPDAVRS